MNNNRPRPATPRAGGGTSVLKQIKGKQAANETNDTPASTVKEGIVQKLQGVLFAVRRDRDREHRNRDIAMEKLRSAKELYETDKSNFEAEKEKLAKTQEEAEKTQQEILEKEKIVAELQQKVRKAKRYDAFIQVEFLTLASLWIPPQYQFQHEDLLRKREKIQQQESSLESTASKRNELMVDVRKRLDRQRNKYQEIKESEDKASENLLATMVSLAIRKGNEAGAVAVPKKIDQSEAAHQTIDGVIDQSGKKVQAGKPEDRITIDETLIDKGSDVKATDPKEPSGLDQFLDELEAKKEVALANEFKTNIDYDMLPTMISQKAQALQTESEKMLAEIARLETLLYGETKFVLPEEENDPESDAETIACSESQFEADPSSDIGEIESMRAEAPPLDNEFQGKAKPDKGSQNQGQQSDADRILNSEITFERKIDGVGKMQTNGGQFDTAEKSNDFQENGHDSDVDTIIGSDADFDEGLNFDKGLDESFSAFSESAHEQVHDSNTQMMRGETTQLEALLQVAAKARACPQTKVTTKASSLLE